MSFFVQTRFVWRFGGQQVHLCGSFTRWVETVQMPPVPDAPGVFAVLVHLPPGYHQYKFIVDGEWRHDETQPNMPDPLGNVNNWLFVRRAEPVQQTGAQPGIQQQQVEAQQAQQQAQQQQQEQQQQQAQQQAQQLAAHQAAAMSQQEAPVLIGTSPTDSASEDVEMAEQSASGVVAPIALQPGEPLQAAAEMTKKKVMEFLASHTAYELIPESGKVVLLDTELPVRQAFHALHEQGIASAPLWDTESASIVGMISASDFIQILRHLRNSVSSGGNPLSEQQMDAHTIKHMREEAVLMGQSHESLVYCRPDDSLKAVAQTLYEARHSMAPIVSADPASSDDGSGDGQIPNLLHVATISGVLACLLRHFRASLSSLPLLSHPIGSLPLGSWLSSGGPDGDAAAAPDNGSEGPAAADAASADTMTEGAHLSSSGGHQEAPAGAKRIGCLQTVGMETPLTTALQLLLEKGVSSLPVVDENGVLLDVYSRSDITVLAKGNSYSRLQWEEVTVGQALALGGAGAASSAQPQPGASGPGPVSSLTTGLVAAGLASGEQQQQQQQVSTGSTGSLSGTAPNRQRVFMCTKRDSLRTVVERLSVPGVRRLIAVDPETRRVEGVVSLSDIAAYLFVA